MSNPKGLTPYDARSPLEELNGISVEKARERLVHAIISEGSGGQRGQVAKALAEAKAVSGQSDDAPDGDDQARAANPVLQPLKRWQTTKAPPIERYWEPVSKAKGGPLIAVYSTGVLVGIVDQGDLTKSATAPKAGQVQFENAQGQSIGFADPAKVRKLQAGTPVASSGQPAVRHSSLEPSFDDDGNPSPEMAAIQAKNQPGAVAKALLAQRQLAQRQKAFQRGLEREVDGLVRKQQAGVPVLFLTVGQDRVVRKRLAGGRLTPLEERALLLLQRQTKPAPLPRVKRSR
ncbi:MAG: hypothetical protein WBF51_01685 [Candidatus Dormiibacterota bacterium]